MLSASSPVASLSSVARRRRLILFFLVTLLGAAGLLAYVLRVSYEDAERKAETEARNIVSTAEARLGATFRRIHSNLEHVASGLPLEALQPGVSKTISGGVTRDLSRYRAHFPEVIGFRITNRAGKAIYSSEREEVSVDISDRGYFKSLAENPMQNLVFSEVITARQIERQVLMLAVPLRQSDGAFAGVVTAAIDLGHFAALFEAVDLGPNGVITLRRSDNGRLVIRRPAKPDAVNKTLHNNPMHLRIEMGDRSGTIRFEAALDKVERIYAYQRIGDYPVYVAAGIAADDYLASWRKTLISTLASFMLLVLGLLLVLIRGLRAEKEEESVAAKLFESEARYRMLADNSHDVIWTIDIPTRRFTYISPSVKALRGFAPEEVMSKSVDEGLTPESAQKVNREIDQRLRRIAAGDLSANIVTTELDQIRRDGSVVSTEVVSTYLLDSAGVPRTILGITRNVSERKAAEAALRESNLRLQEQLREIERLQAALREQAVRDGLTGLYNRRYLDETLEREVARARREGNPLSLVMMDIDHFKNVNDTYGHQVGDEVLRLLSATLLADIRTEDVACRYGGEEFLILLPNMPLAAALERAESWRSEVAALQVRHGGFQLQFTVSLGVASYPEHGKTPDELTRCADQALYRAKAEGRNRVLAFA